jgi:transposase
MDPLGILKGVKMRQNELIRVAFNKNPERISMKNISVVGIDLAKEVFQVHGNDASGKCLVRRKLRRSEVLNFCANLAPCKVAMEACGSANYWAREITKLGHEVVLIAPQFVKPFVKTNKNDAADAEAIAEAATRPNMRFVPVKNIWQQELQAVHRARSLMVSQRVASSNALRSYLSEQGFVCATGEKSLFKLVGELLLDEQKFSGFFRDLLIRMTGNIQSLQKEIDHLERQIKSFAGSDDRCVRIQEINGVGPITASAIVAAVGSPSNFKNGRHFAAWLGLVPRQNSSGGKEKLMGISKRGDGYLRSLLIHGARAALQFAPKREDYRSKWVTKKAAERGHNKATVALANRNARVIWALLAKNETYRPHQAA